MSRPVPTLDDRNRPFWTSGGHGELRLLRCAACGYWIHPPRPRCPRCHSPSTRWEATSGLATLLTFTVNRKAWNPAVPVPYVIAIVELPEQAGLRLTTNVVHCPIDAVHIGMALRVVFEEHDGVFVPLFEPAP